MNKHQLSPDARRRGFFCGVANREPTSRNERFGPPAAVLPRLKDDGVRYLGMIYLAHLRLLSSSMPYRQLGLAWEATMLAELFILRLEARLKAPREPTSFTKSDTRFVPIQQPVPGKEGKPQTDK